MGLSLRLEQRLECGACGSIDWSNERIVPLLLTLEPYRFCPNCGSEVDPDTSEKRRFRNKWDRAFKLLLEKLAKGDMIKM